MPTIPHRQALIDAVVERLRGIKYADGYATDAGNSVFEHRDPLGEPFNESELPACWIRDGSSEITALDSSVHEHSLSLEIGAHVSDMNAPAAGRLLESDILKAVGVDNTFGGLCVYCQPTGGTLEVKREGKRQAGVRLLFEVRFRVNAWDNYTQHTGPR